MLSDWYRQLLVARRYVVLFPLVVDQKPLGLFYVDGDASGAHILTPPVLNYHTVLRGQAVVAIHKKGMQTSGRRR